MNNWPGVSDQGFASLRQPAAGIVCGAALRHHGVALYKSHLKALRRTKLKRVALSCMVIAVSASREAKPACLATLNKECLQSLWSLSSSQLPHSRLAYSGFSK